MIAGVGVDTVQISRFARFLEPGRGAVLSRLFTIAELDYALTKKVPAPHLAARFAAKEAYVKALGLGLRQGMSWTEIEVVRDGLGAPSLQLSGVAAQVAAERGITHLHLSYSHDGDQAVATVVLEVR